MQLRTNYAANRIINAISHNIRHEHRHTDSVADGAKRPKDPRSTAAHSEIKMRSSLSDSPSIPSSEPTPSPPEPTPSPHHSIQLDSTVTTVDLDRPCILGTANPRELSRSKWGLCAWSVGSPTGWGLELVEGYCQLLCHHACVHCTVLDVAINDLWQLKITEIFSIPLKLKDQYLNILLYMMYELSAQPLCLCELFQKQSLLFLFLAETAGKTQPRVSPLSEWCFCSFPIPVFSSQFLSHSCSFADWQTGRLAKCFVAVSH